MINYIVYFDSNYKKQVILKGEYHMIGFFERNDFPLTEIKHFDLSSLSIQKLHFENRENVENNPAYIQPIVIAAISNNQNYYLSMKKKRSSLSEQSPEKNTRLLYFGGHISHLDLLPQCNNLLDIAHNTLKRELREELGITVFNYTNQPFSIYNASKHVAFVFFISIENNYPLLSHEFNEWSQVIIKHL